MVLYAVLLFLLTIPRRSLPFFCKKRVGEKKLMIVRFYVLFSSSFCATDWLRPTCKAVCRQSLLMCATCFQVITTCFFLFLVDFTCRFSFSGRFSFLFCCFCFVRIAFAFRIPFPFPSFFFPQVVGKSSLCSALWQRARQLRPRFETCRLHHKHVYSSRYVGWSVSKTKEHPSTLSFVQ